MEGDEKAVGRGKFLFPGGEARRPSFDREKEAFPNAPQAHSSKTISPVPG
jgi:hypothetical protein